MHPSPACPAPCPAPPCCGGSPCAWPPARTLCNCRPRAPCRACPWPGSTRWAWATPRPPQAALPSRCWPAWGWPPASCWTGNGKWTTPKAPCAPAPACAAPVATCASWRATPPPSPPCTAAARASPSASATASGAGAGTAAGVRQAEVTVEIEGQALRAQLAWASDRAGEVQANVSTRLTPGAPGASPAAAPSPSSPVNSSPATSSPFTWAPDAPLAGTLRARLPDVGVWSALAPPGWRVRGTLDASATLSGTRNAPRWAGTLGADDMAVRSVVDGVDLQGGRLRATLQGNQLSITEFRLQGGRGSGARIAGFSGNRTAAPQDGGMLTATGRVSWGDSATATATAATGLSGITMSLQAEAKALQELVRADRQISVSGQLQAQLQQGQISLRGKLTTDRATIILPDETAPTLGSDVVVRSAAKDREDQAKAQAAAKANQVAAQAETAKPPDIAITLNLGRDFALQGQGITTRLTGEVDIRSSAVPGAPPRVTGEVRTD